MKANRVATVGAIRLPLRRRYPAIASDTLLVTPGPHGPKRKYGVTCHSVHAPFSGSDRPGRGSGVRSLVGKSSRSGKASEYEGQRSYQQDAEAHHCKAHGIKGGGSEHRDRSTLPGAHQKRQIHERQRPKICARAGSAARLNAGSHPIGGRDRVDTDGDEILGVCLIASDKRSPLLV